MTDLSKVDIMENLSSISGLIKSFNFDTDPLTENEWSFKAENKENGLKIKVQFYDLKV